MEEFSNQLSRSFDALSTKLTGWLNEIILQLPNLFIALFIAVISFFISKYIKKIVIKAVRKITKNKTLTNLAGNLTAVIFGLIVLFIILTIFNLGGAVNKILATAGVVGLAIGLALQDPVNNLFSGVSMAVRKLYKIGDLVETNGYFGFITDINLRSTRLRLPSGQDVIIPNKEVIQNPLKNYSSSGERRVDVNCGVSYSANLEEVEQLVRKTISSLDDLHPEKPIDVFFTEFGGSSINFTTRYWIITKNNKDYLVEKSKGVKAIKTAFDANNISIPFPITTLDFGIEGGVNLEKQLSLVKKNNRTLERNNI